MIVHVLGAAGWIPGAHETSCFMVEHNESLFFLDAGTGMSNLRHHETVLTKYKTLHILLSHYHLDHTIGLTYLLPYANNKVIRIYGPGKMAYPETTSYYMHSLFRQEFFSRRIESFSHDVKCLDFPSAQFTIDKTQIRVRQQAHSSPSFRISLDDKLIYATDTSFDPEEWVNERAALLLHECWDSGKSFDEASKHTSLQHFVRGIPTENFEKIVLVHQNPAWDNEDYRIIEDALSDSNITLAHDNMMLTV